MVRRLRGYLLGAGYPASIRLSQGITDLRRLMTAACLRVGGLLNQADLARDVHLAPSTVQRYLNLLEVSFQLVRLPSYSVNRTKRLVKSSKLYWGDTGLALHLAGEGTSPRRAPREHSALRPTRLGLYSRRKNRDSLLANYQGGRGRFRHRNGPPSAARRSEGRRKRPSRRCATSAYVPG